MLEKRVFLESIGMIAATTASTLSIAPAKTAEEAAKVCENALNALRIIIKE